MKVQRLRVTFTRGEELKYITHLDLMRFWERALRRAALPVAYSEGFTPHPQISLAAPLPVGTTSEAELMDVFTAERIRPREFMERASEELPPSVRIRAVEEVGMSLPSVQGDVRSADYDVDVPADGSEEVRAAVERFLAAETVPWEHRRDEEIRTYDIRELVRDIRLRDSGEGVVRLWMRLRQDNRGSGRPEQVVAALGLAAPLRIHRTGLLLAGTSPALTAWRKRGRFAG
jgi:radical SAM-linked protein